MLELTDSLKALLQETAEHLKGHEHERPFHRAFQPPRRRSTWSLGCIQVRALHTMNIRPSKPPELEALVDIWLRSVRATHTFLTESDVQELLLIVREQALSNLELWVLCTDDAELIDFMGLSDNSIEALFIAPEHLRCGGGTMLVEHARQIKGILRVDVNEQNPNAIRFYIANGFHVIGRSPLDSDGRPFPLLHMREALMQPSYNIVLAQPKHLKTLADIEVSAASLLKGYAPTSVLKETTPLNEFRKAQEEGRLWVALADEIPVGFALVEMLDANHPHLQEMDVVPDHGRRGIGTTLLRMILEWTRRSGYEEITLTTFRAVPWNMPFYSQHGFEEVPADELRADLKSIVQNEAERGLEPNKRVVMRCSVRHRLLQRA